MPAYPLLWSRHDEVNRHYRRYQRRTLLAAAVAAGWAPVHTTYFNTLLLAPAAVVRLSHRHTAASTDRSDLDRTPRSLDTVLEMPMRVEATLLRHGLRLPAGLSLLALLRNEAPGWNAAAPDQCARSSSRAAVPIHSSRCSSQNARVCAPGRSRSGAGPRPRARSR